MKEKYIYVIGAAVAVVLVCMMLSVLFPAEAAAETEANMHDSEKDAQTETDPETAKNDIMASDFAGKSQNRTTNGHINARKALKVLEESDEPETEEETGTVPAEEERQDLDPGTEEAISDQGTQEAETSADPTEDEAVGTGFRIYRIAGELPDPELQRAIWDALQAENISYWYEGSLAQCFQESHFQRFCVNPNNGLDSGLFQYRSTFWDWSQGDIFDAGVQIRKYAAEMAARFNAGLSADEAISRHKTSDYCTDVDWAYVAQVKQWLPLMEEVK